LAVGLWPLVFGRWSLAVGKILPYERPGFIAAEPDDRIAAKLRSDGFANDQRLATNDRY